MGDLEKAQAAGNLEQVAGLQANLAEKLLAHLGNLNAQNKDAQVGILSAKASIDAKTLSRPMKSLVKPLFLEWVSCILRSWLIV